MAQFGPDQFLSQVHSSHSHRDYSHFHSLFDPSAATPAYHQLKAALNNIPSLRPSSYTSLARSTFKDSNEERPLGDLCAAYLLFVRDGDLDSWDSRECIRVYTLLEECFKAIDKIFSYPDSAWFIPTLRKFTTALVQAGLKASKASHDPKAPQASSAARVFRRPMTIASSDRSETIPSKRTAIFHLANSTFRIYFALKNLRLCDTVLNSVSGVLGDLDNEDRGRGRGLVFGKSDRCCFKYYRGRLWLYQRRLPQARQELLSAFSLCHKDSYHNGRLILTYLIASSLPLGILPSSELLDQFDLADQFGMIVLGLQMGDYKTVLEGLEENEEWHRSKGNYLLLKEKLWVICWRNLFRRTLFVLHSGTPRFQSGPPVLPLEAVLVASRVAFGPNGDGVGEEGENDDELDLDDIESIATSLIDQGFIKGYINSNRRLLVLQRGEQMGFPPVAVVTKES